MSETELSSIASEPPYTGENVLYRERGVSALDVQRAADALLRRGDKPSIAAIREHLGGGSPNTVGPLLEKYWKSLGTRIGAGPQALERVPESLAKMTEALWLRSLDEARERAKAAHSSESAAPRASTDMHSKVTELTAALAEARAKTSETESELLRSLRERLELKEQIQQLTALLGAEQALRAQDRGTAAAQHRELEVRKRQILELARRRLGAKMSRKAAIAPATAVQRKRVNGPKRKASAALVPPKRKTARTRTVKRARR